MPKLGPATRMLASPNCGRLSTNSGSSRHSEKRPAPKPVRSTRLSQSLGMIWSVSTSERSSGTAVPVMMMTGSIGQLLVQVAGVGEGAGDGGGGGDGGGHQMVRPPLPCRPSKFRFEVEAELGMIWSVSTSERSSGTARPGDDGHGVPSVVAPQSRSAGVGEGAGDGGGGGHGGGHEVGAAALALAALEVAVAGGGGPLAGGELVGVHGQAHRAAGLAPVEAGGGEDLVEALGLGLVLHRERAGDDHGPHAVG